MIFEYGKNSITFTQEPIMKVLTITICLGAFLTGYTVSAQWRDLDIQNQTYAIEAQTRAIESARTDAHYRAMEDSADRSRESAKRSQEARQLRKAITDSNRKPLFVPDGRGRSRIGTPKTPEQKAARLADIKKHNREWQAYIDGVIARQPAPRTYQSPTYYYYQQPRRQIYGGYLRGW
jgi:hypothetical protein